jgi:hypothetical protein
MHYQHNIFFKGTLWAAFVAILIILMSTQIDAAWPRHVIDDELRGADGVKLGDVDNDGDLDIVTGWEESGRTRIYFYPGAGNVKKKWPFVDIGETPSVEDAVFFDVDDDGWLDVVTSCEGKTKKMYVHWNPGRDVQKAASAWRQQELPASVSVMQWMFSTQISISSKQPLALVAGGKNKNAALGLFETSQPSHSLDYKWRALYSAGWIMSIYALDMDGDGDEDILYSDRKGENRGCRWMENLDGGQKWTNHLIGAEDREVMFLTYTDVDEDGQHEVVAAVKPNLLLIYHAPKNLKDKWHETVIEFPSNTGSAKAVAAGDLNMDGQIEFIVSCEHALPPKSGVFALHLDDAFQQIESTTDISGPDGIKFDRMELIDMDLDGDLDVLTCEERHNDRGLGVIWYENPLR